MFTKQQILEIQQKLASLGVRDTDFQLLRDIDGDEYIVVVDGGQNRKILVSELDKYLFDKNLNDIDEIRRGAKAGLTAYHIPEGGIPKNKLSYEVRVLLDKANIAQRTRYGTTEQWNTYTGFIPSAGEIIVYSDYKTVVEDNQTIYVPGIKIGNGNAYVQDLAFVGDVETDALMEHIHNTAIHVSSSDRTFWNNKMNVNDSQEVVNNTLIFNRN